MAREQPNVIKERAGSDCRLRLVLRRGEDLSWQSPSALKRQHTAEPPAGPVAGFHSKPPFPPRGRGVPPKRRPTAPRRPRSLGDVSRGCAVNAFASRDGESVDARVKRDSLHFGLY